MTWSEKLFVKTGFEQTSSIGQYLKDLGVTVAFIIEGVHRRHQ